MKNNHTILTLLLLFLSVSLKAQDGIESSLIFHYSFENDFADASGNINTGIENGEITFTEGKYGQAAYFDESISYIESPDNLFTPDNQYTLCFWLNIHDDSLMTSSPGPTFVQQTDGRTISTMDMGSYDPSLSPFYYSYMGGAVSIFKTAPEFNTWVHHAMVIDQENSKLSYYINGVLDSEFTDIAYGLGVGALRFGAHKNPNDYRNFIGQMDEIMLFDKLLTEEEIGITMNNFEEPLTWDNRPSSSFTTQYEQSFEETWDDATFYGQWDAAEPNSFTADDITEGFLQFEWSGKRLLRSKMTFDTSYVFEAALDYSAGSSRGGMVIRAEADGTIDHLQEPADGDPGFNREGIAFYPTDDGSAMTVQFTGPVDPAGTPVTRIQVPKPDNLTSLIDSNVYRIEDYGASVYVFLNDNPFIRIDLEGQTDTTYTSGTVYTDKMQVAGTFSDMEIEKSGKLAIAQRDAALRLYSASVKVVAKVPGAPTNVSATAENVQAEVSFTPPANNGGSEIVSYTVTSTPDGFSETGTGSPITITGLNSNTTYTFTVVATNAIGNSVDSEISNEITTTFPVGVNNMAASAFNLVYQRGSVIVVDLTGLCGEQKVSFYDLQGKCMVSRQSDGGNQLEIADELKTGVYIVRIQGEKNFNQAKIILR